MSYNFGSIVNKNEAEALKEMIFNRVRERSKGMQEDAQSEIMDMARSSFVSKNNPFSQIVQQEVKNPEVGLKTSNDEFIKQEPSESESLDIGFPIKERKIVKEQNQVINAQIASETVKNTMIEARSALSNRKSFLGALEFLNSQAAVSLIRTRADKFEMIV